jgi:hypothetical protein
LPLSELDELSKRPSFLLVRVDAGLMVRFQRCVIAGDFDSGHLPAAEPTGRVVPPPSTFNLHPSARPSRCRRAALSGRSSGANDLAQFALQSDESLYGTGLSSSVSHVAPVVNAHATHADPSPLNDLTAFVGLAVVNNYASLDALYVHLEKVKLDDAERLRPGWDRYFMVRPHRWHACRARDADVGSEALRLLDPRQPCQFAEQLHEASGRGPARPKQPHRLDRL